MLSFQGHFSDPRGSPRSPVSQGVERLRRTDSGPGFPGVGAPKFLDQANAALLFAV